MVLQNSVLCSATSKNDILLRHALYDNILAIFQNPLAESVCMR